MKALVLAALGSVAFVVPASAEDLKITMTPAPAAALAKGLMIQSGAFAANRSEVPTGVCSAGEAGKRRQIRTIKFSPPFAAPPTVVVSLNTLDFDQAQNLRVQAYAQGVTRDAATIVVET